MRNDCRRCRLLLPRLVGLAGRCVSRRRFAAFGLFCVVFVMYRMSGRESAYHITTLIRMYDLKSQLQAIKLQVKNVHIGFHD